MFILNEEDQKLDLQEKLKRLRILYVLFNPKSMYLFYFTSPRMLASHWFSLQRQAMGFLISVDIKIKRVKSNSRIARE